MAESDAVTVTSTPDEVVVITFDDGKANAYSHAAIADIRAGFRDAADAKAVVLAGRPGKFSAGFDLGEIQKGPDEAREMLRAGAEMSIQVFEHPTPTIAASTGHALAMGAIMLFAFDRRIGVDKDAKIGMNEVAIGMALPRFAIELARERLSKRHFNSAANLAQVYGPEDALAAGYFDRLDGDPVEAAAVEAAALADALHPRAFAETRQRIRGAVAARIRDGLDRDVAEFEVHD